MAQSLTVSRACDMADGANPVVCARWHWRTRPAKPRCWRHTPRRRTRIPRLPGLTRRASFSGGSQLLRIRLGVQHPDQRPLTVAIAHGGRVLRIARLVVGHSFAGALQVELHRAVARLQLEPALVLR